MATTRWQHDSGGAPPVGDVVAALPGDGSASAASRVARAAVREAMGRGARVRFLQVLRPGLSAEDRAARDEATFTTALRALREAPRLPVTFEVVDGDPAEVCVRRSHGASVLVVAQDSPDGGGLAAYCLANADCDVLTVRSEHVPVPH